MSPVEYFKLQAKKLFKDYKTKSKKVDQDLGITYYFYSPTYYDIDRIFGEYDWDEKNFSLMKAQHLFAHMLGYRKWGELINSSDAELELAKLLWENQHKIGLEDWSMYLIRAEARNNKRFEARERLEIFRQVFVEVDGHRNPFGDYRLKI
ncbi:hypothetical protein A8B79_04515 [Balneola sp. EhC07]|uniref:hypothetical protein n=1 Tax=Balneola sp. EhC07 TaxID=1849360 RepID=UPI0007F489A8|nr:hypothetical protein [Balneola sp. EhC07]OAN61694.1 hypothetical protein A8B79_04515 [Balneola sp. EhC07]